MKIIVTGGCGFIGGTLIRKLLLNKRNHILNIDKFGYASDHEAIDNFLKETKNENYKFIKLDLKEKNNLYEIINSFKPNIIMHLAAETHVDRSIDTPEIFIESNIIGTFNILEASRQYLANLNNKQKSNFIFHHISTDEVFGSLGESGQFFENYPYDPRSPYSASKASSDHLVRSYFHTYDLPIIITNCSNNFGPWQYPEKLIPLVINKALNSERIPIYGDGSNIRDWLFVEDHVAALLLCAIDGKLGETYCIGGYGERTNKFVVEKICNILDKKKPLLNSYKSLITYVEDRPGHDKRYAINSSKITKDLGWKPKFGFTKGLEKTVEWYIRNNEWCKKILIKSKYNCERIGL
tara:strand:+ start:1368 stop:2423 length:1056 start_codon:yes stop_codon:yes gene_type:complete